jgi:hypothetical protein
VTPAVFDPAPPIVLRVIHHGEDIQFAGGIEHPPDESEAVVAHVEDDAVSNLIG